MKELAAGAFFIATGFLFGYMSLSYAAGTLAEMGPGFYPRVFSIALIVIGLINVSRALLK